MEMYERIIQNSKEAIRAKEGALDRLQAEKQALKDFEQGR